MIKKGTYVTVHATLGFFYSFSPDDLRSDGFAPNETVMHEPAYRKGVTRKFMLRMACKPWVGMVVGWTQKSTGWYKPGRLPVDSYDDNYEQASLEVDVYHRVWCIIPIDSERWSAPVYCDVTDLNEYGEVSVKQSSLPWLVP